MLNLIGYDASVNDMYAGYEHSFDSDDVYADIDAVNIYNLLNVAFVLKKTDRVDNAFLDYFKDGYKKRFSSFVSNGINKNKVYTYTKTYYIGDLSNWEIGKYTIYIKQADTRWPLLDDEYDYNDTQSQAARDAFIEFLSERKQYE